MKKVYLAGQFSEYNGWKNSFENIDGFEFYNPEIDSNQYSSDAYFSKDLQAISDADILIANPGIAPSEGTWIEVGYFLARNNTVPGEKCDNLIIIWDKGRLDWSIEFVKKAGHVVRTVDDAVRKLNEIQVNLNSVEYPKVKINL